MDKFHENIRRVRERLGYSQDVMADLMGIERSTYSNFELGKTRLFAKSMTRFAKAIGLTEEEILLDGSQLTAGYLQSGVLEDRLEAVESKIDAISDKLDAILKKRP